jgi:hypothetical protein
MKILRVSALFACCLLSTALVNAAEPATMKAMVKAIVGATVVDLDGESNLRDAVVLVEGERIAAIGVRGDVSIPDGAEVIDATGTWLIPGLMNMHVHLGLVLPGKMEAELANESEAELALRMAAAARESLQAGVTTIRLPGDQRHGDLALNRAIEKGQADGPRIFSAGESLVITGGHGSEKGKTYSDGPYELVKAARREISAGASWIKILISGGDEYRRRRGNRLYRTRLLSRQGRAQEDETRRDLVRADDCREPAGDRSLLRKNRFAGMVPEAARFRGQGTLGSAANCNRGRSEHRVGYGSVAVRAE